MVSSSHLVFLSERALSSNGLGRRLTAAVPKLSCLAKMRRAFTASATTWSRPNRALRPSHSAEERMAWAHTAAAFLRAQGARKVWLFGSLAKGRRQDWRSDLDLAVEGLAPERYLGSLGELLLRSPIDIDLVDLDTASDPLRDQIITSGLLLDAD